VGVKRPVSETVLSPPAMGGTMKVAQSMNDARHMAVKRQASAYLKKSSIACFALSLSCVSEKAFAFLRGFPKNCLKATQPAHSGTSYRF